MGSHAKTVPDARPGPRISGRYELHEGLGDGGAASVVRAFDHAAQRFVAMKRLRARTTADRDAALRFRNEFHTLARLGHPRIVEVFDFGYDDENQPFYTMELLGGEDLRARSPESPEQACRLLRDVASALAFLHARGWVHRDVAPRNVRCTEDGRAKLIDFGALATIGPSRQIIGTPPFIPPEAVHGLPLDPRSDLFSLGALAYWLLTGRHAYPGRQIPELVESWRSAPEPLSSLVPGIPEPLDVLVTSLLAVEPASRPRTAAEVIERLGAIAKLPPLNESAAARAYLQTNTLVGCERELKRLRRRLDLAIRGGRGQSVSIEAASGSGKSRLLRELGLEAQLAGAAVIDVEVENATSSALSLARRLIDALANAVPDVLVDVIGPYVPVLGRVLPNVLAVAGTVPLAPALNDPREEHARVQSAFVNLITAIAAKKPLVLLVDDVQWADEASMTLLASLAQVVSDHRILLGLGTRTDVDPRAPEPFAVLRDASRSLRIRPLGREDTRRLVQMIFGDVRYGSSLADWLYGKAQGNVMLAVELAKFLVEREVVRYVEGFWVIPQNLEVDDLPTGLSAAMDASVDRLPSAARDLAEVLALAGGVFPLERIVLLSASESENEAFAALDELLSREVLIGSAEDGYRFRHSSVSESLVRRLGGDRRASLHLRIAQRSSRALPIPPDREVEIGFHFLRGGDAERAAPLLERGGMRSYEAHAFADAISPLEASLAIHEEIGTPDERTLEVRFALVVAGYMADRESLMRHADRVLEVTRRLAGIDTVARLRPRFGGVLSLLVGIGAAALRRILRPRPRRGPDIATLLRMYVISASFALAGAVVTYEIERMERLRDDLAPLAIGRKSLTFAAHLFAQTLTSFVRGDHTEVAANAEAIARAVRKGKVAPFDAKLMEGGARTLTALVHAPDGSSACLEEIAQLETLGLKVFQVTALQAKSYYHRCRSEYREAEEAERRHETEAFRLGGAWQTVAWRPIVEGVAGGLVRDPMALKRAIEDLTSIANRPGFGRLRVNLLFAKGEYYRERGELHAARDSIEAALAELPPGGTVFTVPLVAAHCDTLFLLGDYREAARVAREGLELSERCGRAHAVFRCGRILALCEAADGRTKEAAARLDGLLERARALGNPVSLSELHEARAQVAELDGDSRTSSDHLETARALASTTQMARLRSRDPRSREGRGDDPTRTEPTTMTMADTAYELELRTVSIRRRLDAEPDPNAKARLALDIVLTETQSEGGILLWSRGDEELVISRGEKEAPADVVRSLRDAVAAANAPDDDVSATMTVAPSGEVGSAWCTGVMTEGGGRAIGGVAVRGMKAGNTLPYRLLRMLAAGLMPVEATRQERRSS